jgi:hypothetical protein
MNNIEGWNPGERASLGSGGSHKKDTCDKFLERRSWSMELESPVAYEEGRNGHCRGVGPLRNGRRNSISVRVAGEVGAPATPGVIVPSSEKVTVRMREREKS